MGAVPGNTSSDTHTRGKITLALAHHLASGLMIWGWSQMNVGLTQSTSTKSPTSCVWWVGRQDRRAKRGCHGEGLLMQCTSVHQPCQAAVTLCVVEDTQCCSSHRDRPQTDEILEHRQRYRPGLPTPHQHTHPHTSTTHISHWGQLAMLVHVRGGSPYHFSSPFLFCITHCLCQTLTGEER